jgi:hypothetical protein
MSDVATQPPTTDHEQQLAAQQARIEALEARLCAVMNATHALIVAGKLSDEAARAIYRELPGHQASRSGRYHYIGRKPDCGCVVASAIDTGEDRPSVARSVARFVRRGLTVERVSVEYVQKYFVVHCPHEAAQVALPLAEASHP